MLYRKAFTLIELLVVIAIIAILAAILFPVFAQAREKARMSTCASNEKQIGLAFTQYEQDYDETIPPGDAFVYNGSSACLSSWFPPAGVATFCGNGGAVNGMWMGLIYPYTKSTGVYYCPSGPSVVDAAYWNTNNGTTCGLPIGDPGRNYGFAVNSLVIQTGVWDNGGINAGTCAVVSASRAFPTMPISKIGSPTTTIMLGDRGQTDRTCFGVDDAGPTGGSWANCNGTSTLDVGTHDQMHYGVNPSAFRHQGGANNLFCDGHVKYLTYGQFQQNRDMYEYGGLSHP